MAAATLKDRWTEMPSEMKVPLIISALFHGALVIVALAGLPFYSKPPDTMSTAIPIEILPIGEMTTSNKPPVKARPIEEKPPETKAKTPLPPKVEAVEPPKEKPKPVEAPKEKPKPVTPPPPEEKLDAPKEKPKPVEKQKPKEEAPPKEKEKPKEEKPVSPEQQQSFDSLLKNLQGSEQVVDESLPESKTPDAPAPSADAPFSENMTMSELDALRQQLSRCWSIQAGARYAENLAVEVRMLVSQDRRVISASIVDQWRYGQDSYFRAAADSALRAINSPQCEILNLNPDKYNLWKDIVVTFDPRDML